MGEACSTYGEEEEFVQVFGRKTRRKETKWNTRPLQENVIKMDRKEVV